MVSRHFTNELYPQTLGLHFKKGVCHKNIFKMSSCFCLVVRIFLEFQLFSDLLHKIHCF
jgi:hypothetical protein